MVVGIEGGFDISECGRNEFPKATTYGHQGKTLHFIDIRNIHFQENSVKIVIGDTLKTSNAKTHLGEIELMKYDVDKDLCVRHTLSNYLEKTETRWGSVTRFFITSQRQHKFASRDTIGRWQELTPPFSNPIEPGWLPPAPRTH